MTALRRRWDDYWFAEGGRRSLAVLRLAVAASILWTLGRVLLSWVDPQGNMRITQILHDITEPMLGPIRSVMPQMQMIDFSPIIAMLLLQALGQLIASAIPGI